MLVTQALWQYGNLIPGPCESSTALTTTPHWLDTREAEQREESRSDIVHGQFYHDSLFVYMWLSNELGQ